MSEPTVDPVSVADLFHVLRDLGRPLGRSLGQQLAQLDKRLFGHPFPDLFESVLTTFTELRMPRRSSSSQQPNPWYGQSVPA